MEIYEVGGTVRDTLLGLPVADRDWVVVGGSAEALEGSGFRRVGKDFPVFLHPDTNEEYALARKERKIAPGYRGFRFDTSSEVTLEQDLARRDLTINAMARTADGRIIDPFGGRSDIESRQLRHVSPAFREDPVRVLRVARFGAKLSRLGFKVAPETLALMREIAAGGELDALTPERVWAETEKALITPDPATYIEILRAGDALGAIFPEIERLFGVPQPARWHPEIDTGIHTLMALRQAAALTPDASVRFAVLVHDLGKGTTPRELLPRHHGHEDRSVVLIRALAQRLRIPKRYETLALRVAAQHVKMHDVQSMRPAKLLDLLEDVGALRDADALDDFVLACEADARGRTGLESEPYPAGGYLRAIRDAALAVSSVAVPGHIDEGPAFGAALRELRIRAIAECRKRLRIG